MSARLPMKTHQEAQRTFARLIRAYNDDLIETGKFRALTYAFSTMLSYFKVAVDAEVLDRLEEIEAQLEEGGR